MIICTQYDNLYKYGHAFHAQFRLRHECFIKRQDYNVANYNGMEFDQYDTPAAVYLVYLGPDGDAWGCSRLTPTIQSSMLQDLWPNLVNNPADIINSTIWEGTRFCIKKSLPIDLRARICQELVVAYFEVGLKKNINKIIGVMQPYIFRRVFGRTGCQYSFLGPQMKIENGEVIAAAAMEITPTALTAVRQKTSIHEKVIFEGNIDLNNYTFSQSSWIEQIPPITANVYHGT